MRDWSKLNCADRKRGWHLALAALPWLEAGEELYPIYPTRHYTSRRSEALFQSMMWYGRMTFRLKARDPEVGKEETRSAYCSSRRSRRSHRWSPGIGGCRTSTAQPLHGRALRDLTALQYLDVMEAVYGQRRSFLTLWMTRSYSSLSSWLTSSPPKILGMVILTPTKSKK